MSIPKISSGYSPDDPSGDADYVSSHPNEQLGFELSPSEENWSLAPEFYPEDFTQMKKKELSRFGGGCGGESVSVKSIKNREFHVSGVILNSEINTFQALLDYEHEVDLISPLTPKGGMECFIKKGELGNQHGFDPQTHSWIFKYTLDLVSTGRDENLSSQNGIVSSVLSNS